MQATFSKEIKSLAQTILQRPTLVEATPRKQDCTSTENPTKWYLTSQEACFQRAPIHYQISIYLYLPNL